MDLKEIKRFITITQNEITNFNCFIEDYILDSNEIPMFIYLKNDYAMLIEKHFQIITHLNELKYLIHTKDDDFENELNQLLVLKLITDNLIKNHSKYKPKSFETNFKKRKNEFYRIGNPLENHPKNKSKKTILIKELYGILIKNRRLDKTQRKPFIRLFFEDTPKTDKLLWNNKLHDLRAFLILLIDHKLIKLENQSVDDYAPLHFKTLTKNGEFKEFNKNYIKSLQAKETFFKSIDFWEPIITNLSAKFRY